MSGFALIVHLFGIQIIVQTETFTTVHTTVRGGFVYVYTLSIRNAVPTGNATSSAISTPAFQNTFTTDSLPVLFDVLRWYFL